MPRAHLGNPADHWLGNPVTILIQGYCDLTSRGQTWDAPKTNSAPATRSRISVENLQVSRHKKSIHRLYLRVALFGGDAGISSACLIYTHSQGRSHLYQHDEIKSAGIR